MALIRCEECGKEISDTATTCPHCGTKTRFQVATEQKQQNGKTIAGILVAIGIALFLISLTIR